MRFSVIIPTYNRKDLLRRCLTAVTSQDYPDYEVIVVDDASTDGTGELVQREFPQVRYLRQQTNGGQFVARNRGIEVSTGALIAFVDDDCVLPSGWLRGHARYYDDRRVGAVGAEKGPLVPDFYYKFHASHHRDSYHAALRIERITAWESNLRTGSMSMSRCAIEQAGTFDVQFVKGASQDLVRRINRAGYHLVSDPSLYVDHSQDFTLWSFLADHFRDASGSLMTDVKERTLCVRRFVPLLNVARTQAVCRNFHEMFGGSFVTFAAFWGLALLIRWTEVAGRLYYYWTRGRYYRWTGDTGGS